MTTTTHITPGILIDIVCKFYELDSDRLVKRIPHTGRHHKSKNYVKGRQFIHYWLRRNTLMSLNKVGLLMEGIHHSTILHSVDTVNDEMSLYSLYKKEIFALNQLIQDYEEETEEV